MNKTFTKILVAVLTVLLLAGITAYAVTNYGSESDPLITKSYLDEVLEPQLEAELQSQLDQVETQLRGSVPGEFAELSLSAGQTVQCSTGTELVLRSGSAQAAGKLLDTTAGSETGSGSALLANHLYMAAEDGSGLTASGSATVLISGSYIIG